MILDELDDGSSSIGFVTIVVGLSKTNIRTIEYERGTATLSGRYRTGLAEMAHVTVDGDLGARRGTPQTIVRHRDADIRVRVFGMI